MLGLLVAAVLLGRVQTGARNEARVDGLTSIVQTCVGWLGGPIGAATTNLREFGGGIWGAGNLKADHARLKSFERAWSLYEERVQDLLSEVDYLRKLLNLPATAGRVAVAGAVVGYFPHEHRMTVALGTDQGIRPDLPVMAPDGLIGVVHSVEASRCQVRLISSPQFQIGAAVIGAVPVEGIAKGEGRDVLILQLLDLSQPTELDDDVVTSGYSEYVPRGLPIGKVVEVEDDEQFGIRRVRVFPSARLSNVRSVVVLK